MTIDTEQGTENKEHESNKRGKEVGGKEQRIKNTNQRKENK